MAMEKNGEISDATPNEDECCADKTAEAKDPKDHLTSRTAEKAAGCCKSEERVSGEDQETK